VHYQPESNRLNLFPHHNLDILVYMDIIILPLLNAMDFCAAPDKINRQFWAIAAAGSDQG
jgi:hypothetical protein